ncbi:MAG TPA: cytochrome c biogenesis protein CcsA, partial [Gemmataceae bacterium]|nr:cytochrome c biogenesis protein CcsA [Gemmataceae bacterium]
EKWGFLSDVEQQMQEIALPRVREALQKQGQDMEKLAQLPRDQAMDIIQPLLRREMAKARKEMGAGVDSLLEMLASYRDGEAKDFNTAVAGYLAYADESPRFDMARVRTEAFFDRVEPFYQCIGLFIVVFAVGFVGMLSTAFSPEAGRAIGRAAFWLALLTLLFQSWALITRMYIQDRPPVTNLYSAAVWISWGCVLLGLSLEGLFRNGIGNIVAAVPGCLSVFLAHHLAGSGDTLGMLQAVLDTNFWLATHVTVVTFGYVATLVAGVIGAIYVLFGMLTPAIERNLGAALGQLIFGAICFATIIGFMASMFVGVGFMASMFVGVSVGVLFAAGLGLIYLLFWFSTSQVDRTLGKVLSQMLYAVLCFGTFLSFTGTVLGGLWADYSWGRFWGWDPKENGALIIVLWNALILHARWGGIVKQRGIAVLSIVGIMVVGWSFIGTNQLGVGLHSYGFSNTLAAILVYCWAGCLALIAWSAYPGRWWLNKQF